MSCGAHILCVARNSTQTQISLVKSLQTCGAGVQQRHVGHQCCQGKAVGSKGDGKATASGAVISLV